jgi:hypothetical protein
LIAKTFDSALDCRSLQDSDTSPGAFDARSLCKKVVVPFDAQNHNVLGGSPEPYVSNPLRVPNVSSATRSAQKDKVGFDDLIAVLEFVETHPKLAEAALRLTLHEIRTRLAAVQITYPVPNRASQAQVRQALSSFLQFRSGGARMQTVALALFVAIGEILRLYERVESAHVNAADRQTGKAADLECRDAEGRIVLAVEVKDRKLKVTDVQEKLLFLRSHGVTEALFIASGGSEAEREQELTALAAREFSSGQNVYVCDFWQFLDVCLVLFQEAGRRRFLVLVGEKLDEQKSDLRHREAWKEMLQAM